MPETKPPANPVPSAFARRGIDLPGRRSPTDAAADAPAAEKPAPAAAPVAGLPNEDMGRRLIVGRGITLTGEISACDHLVVEGRIEATLRDCKRIDVAEGGVFKGSAEIDEADIGGRFEGDLSARTRLTLRGTGAIAGTVRYGELAVEAGGKITGTIEPLGETAAVTPLSPPASAASATGTATAAAPVQEACE